MPTKFKIFPSTIKDKTIELIKNRKPTIELKSIAKATGVSESWLSLFARNGIPKPDIGRVQTLYEYMSNNKIKI